MTDTVTAPAITVTLGDLMRADEAFPRVLAKLLGKSAYHVAKLARLAAPEIAHFKSERDRYITDLGTMRELTPAEMQAHGLQPGPDGTIPTGRVVTPENQAAFAARMTDLAAIMVTIPWGPIPLAWLDAVSGEDIEALMPLIQEPTA
jgi:hypothetical protein